MEPDPRANPRWLGGEIEEDTEEREEAAHKLRVQLATQRSIADLVAHPGWAELVGPLDEALRQSRAILEDEQKGFEAVQYHRGRIAALRTVLGAPQAAERRQRAISEELSALDRDDEEEDDA